MTNQASGSQSRLLFALLTFVAWVLATLFSMEWASDGTKKPLIETVTHGISWNLVVALAVLAIATVLFGWRDLKFVAPRTEGIWKIIWFPLLYLVLFAVVAISAGLPPLPTIMFVFLNTLLVGLSEEWMFRGVVFRAWLSRVDIWPSIIFTCLMFGGVHILNVFVTGKLGEGFLQAATASMSGLLFLALLIRTGSIWVPIVYHALWDFGSFMISAGAARGDGAEASSPWLSFGLPVLMVLPNFLFALFLLRKVRNGAGAGI